MNNGRAAAAAAAASKTRQVDSCSAQRYRIAGCGRSARRISGWNRSCSAILSLFNARTQFQTKTTADRRWACRNIDFNVPETRRRARYCCRRLQLCLERRPCVKQYDRIAPQDRVLSVAHGARNRRSCTKHESSRSVALAVTELSVVCRSVCLLVTLRY